MLGGALTAKQFTLMRLQYAFENLSALGSLGVGNTNAGDLETALRIPLGISVAKTQRRLGNEAETAPFEIWTQLKDFRHCPERGPIPFPRDNSRVLVLNLRLSVPQLPQQHND